MLTIIPAAGYGTRLLPGSKSIPKEMFPIVDLPAIEYIAKEIKEANLKDLLIITANNKDSIVDYFDRNFQLEYILKEKGKHTLISKINEFNDMNIVTIRQKEQKGLGHAISIGASLVGDQSFIVSLPDMIIMNGGHHMSQMVKIHQKTGKGVIALMRVPMSETSKYGVVAGMFRELHTQTHPHIIHSAQAPTGFGVCDSQTVKSLCCVAERGTIGLGVSTPTGCLVSLNSPPKPTSLGGAHSHTQKGEIFFIHDMIEKPASDPPSDLAIVGRYILPNKTMFLLQNTVVGSNNEIQLTDALKEIAQTDGLIGYIIDDEIHDTGNPLGFIKANMYFGLKNKTIRNDLIEYMRQLIDCKNWI